MNDEMRVDLAQNAREVLGLRVEHERLRVTADFPGQSLGFREVAACDEDAKIGLVRQRLDDAATEVAVTSENDDGPHDLTQKTMREIRTWHEAHIALAEETVAMASDPAIDRIE
jgi:hypothetical protein